MAFLLGELVAATGLVTVQDKYPLLAPYAISEKTYLQAYSDLPPAMEAMIQVAARQLAIRRAAAQSQQRRKRRRPRCSRASGQRPAQGTGDAEGVSMSVTICGELFVWIDFSFFILQIKQVGLESFLKCKVPMHN